MATITTYPTTLPGPDSGAKVVSAERRIIGPLPGVLTARTVQTDRLGTQDLTWLFTAAQAGVFRDWVDATLVSAGAWFLATWPVPEGLIVRARRFTGKLNWRYVPGGSWQVTVTSELMGITAYVSGPADDVGGGSSYTVGLRIITQPVSRTVLEGGTTSFFCEAAGRGPISYQWYKNGTVISGATASLYVTPATTMADHGAAFWCMVQNTATTIQSTIVSLAVTIYGYQLFAIKITAVTALNTGSYHAIITEPSPSGPPWLTYPVQLLKFGVVVGNMTTITPTPSGLIYGNFNYRTSTGEFITFYTPVPAGGGRLFSIGSYTSYPRADAIQINSQGLFNDIGGTVMLEFFSDNSIVRGRLILHSGTVTNYTYTIPLDLVE